MLDSSKTILSFLQGKKRVDLDNDRLLLSGVIREFEIIGEAAGKISEKTQQQFPNLPWRQLTGMRNRLIHAYFDVDTEIVWTTAVNDLPTLCKYLHHAVTTLES